MTSIEKIASLARGPFDQEQRRAAADSLAESYDQLAAEKGIDRANDLAKATLGDAYLHFAGPPGIKKDARLLGPLEGLSLQIDTASQEAASSGVLILEVGADRTSLSLYKPAELSFTALVRQEQTGKGLVVVRTLAIQAVTAMVKGDIRKKDTITTQAEPTLEPQLVLATTSTLLDLKAGKETGLDQVKGEPQDISTADFEGRILRIGALEIFGFLAAHKSNIRERLVDGSRRETTKKQLACLTLLARKLDLSGPDHATLIDMRERLSTFEPPDFTKP